MRVERRKGSCERRAEEAATGSSLPCALSAGCRTWLGSLSLVGRGAVARQTVRSALQFRNSTRGGLSGATHNVRFGRVRLVVFPSERLRLRGETAFRVSLKEFCFRSEAHLRPLSHTRVSDCPGSEPTNSRFRSLATRLLSVAAEHSSPAQSTARRESVKRVESVEDTPRRTDLFRDCRGRKRVSVHYQRDTALWGDTY